MDTKYDPAAYRLYLMNSISGGKTKHILVEGKDDKYLIERLWEDLKTRADSVGSYQIWVDSAEHLIKGNQSSDFSNNRQKVEAIAQSICQKNYAGGFVGFVDRELYKFQWDCESNLELQDILNSHEVAQRLVLSRGHSIENYVFDLSVLCEVLECLSTTVYANSAIQLFKTVFSVNLRIACAVGLAAAKAQVLSKTNSTIDYTLLEITSESDVAFKFDEWIHKIATRDISSQQKRNLSEYYNIYVEQVSRASLSLIRWICHGHIGYDFLRALYEKCIVEVCPSSKDIGKELSGISWVKKEKLFYAFINSWVKKTLQDQYDYPRAIFELLGVVSII